MADPDQRDTIGSTTLDPSIRSLPSPRNSTTVEQRLLGRIGSADNVRRQGGTIPTVPGERPDQALTDPPSILIGDEPNGASGGLMGAGARRVLRPDRLALSKSLKSLKSLKVRHFIFFYPENTRS